MHQKSFLKMLNNCLATITNFYSVDLRYLVNCEVHEVENTRVENRPVIRL